MIKEEAQKILKSGKVLYCPTWYFNSCDGEFVYGTCGYDDCCQTDFDTFDEFWKWYGDEDFEVIG